MIVTEEEAKTMFCPNLLFMLDLGPYPDGNPNPHCQGTACMAFTHVGFKSTNGLADAKTYRCGMTSRDC